MTEYRFDACSLNSIPSWSSLHNLASQISPYCVFVDNNELTGAIPSAVCDIIYGGTLKPKNLRVDDEVEGCFPFPQSQGKKGKWWAFSLQRILKQFLEQSEQTSSNLAGISTQEVLKIKRTTMAVIWSTPYSPFYAIFSFVYSQWYWYRSNT